MMQIQAIFYDSTYSTTTQQRQYIAVSATFSRSLDKAGRGSASFALDSELYRTLLTVKNICELWIYPHQGEKWTKRKWGAFVIENIQLVHDGANIIIQLDGPDTLSLLSNYLALPNLTYQNQTLSSVLSSLATLAGWSVSSSGLGSLYTTLRYNGENVLKAIQTACETHGVHFRNSSTANTFEAGAFGSSNGKTIRYVEGIPNNIYSSSSVDMLIKSILIEKDGSDLVTRIFPYGAGDGDAALTIGDSSYSPSSVSANGRLHYYIEQNTGTYGVISRRVDFKRVGVIGTSASEVEQSADTLYNQALAWLNRYSSPLTTIKVDVVNVTSELKVGDKVHLNYVLNVWDRGVSTQIQEIDALYWIMDVKERFDENGLTASLVLTSTDRKKKDVAETIVNMMDKIDVQTVHQQPSLNNYTVGPVSQFVGLTTTDFQYGFKIRDETVKVNKATLVVRRRYYIYHTHKMGVVLNATLTAPVELTPQLLNVPDGSGGFFKVGVLTDATTGDELNSTVDFPTEFATYLPEDLDISVNGTSIVTGLWAGNQITLETEYDITSAIRNRVGGLQGTHEVLIVANSYVGEIEIEIVIEDLIRRIEAV